MSNDDKFLISEAFLACEDKEYQSAELTIMPVMETVESARMKQQSALETTLGVALSAASFVLYPYVAAGKAVAHVTSIAVSAPLLLHHHVRSRVAQSWMPLLKNHKAEDKANLVEERSSRRSSGTHCSSIEKFEEQNKPQDSGSMSQLLHLPVRLAYSGVFTVVVIPTRVVTYSGQTISAAMLKSHQLALLAIAESTKVMTRTGMRAARKISRGAMSTVNFTASTLSGAVGVSIRTVSYSIPPSISNAVWQGVDITGNASVNVLSHAITVPSYRMLKTLLPIETLFSEEEAVAQTRSAVKMLVKLFGPQNAIYMLKWIYETVNSEEVFDAFLLCRDIVQELLNGDNYRHASSATGFTKVAIVMQEAYSVLPSLDEMLDAAVLLADVSDEMVDGAVYFASGKDFDARDEISEEERISRFEFVDDAVSFTEVTFERERSGMSSDEELDPILDSGISFLSRVCDSEEATSLFNTFGDVLDILID
ncbi:uncharacterized protein PHALS_02656 [Plasmopara halstedii]|uniref:Uncharacterized protein n=1 Tax=Plasmopara halstedii TaxID=4781 RepID=A0A0P1AW70_PLAHL|nr:uncharacterized protein PHALS_02656 [Plasmopara halstedii]CEG46242.1 hypothetical protein PHALS_02656 [Plasmopara halstedii]|eukprot:XP_024582611.1 hypothetical protein PHALS_02656 [Plasmopara halstedii]